MSSVSPENYGESVDVSPERLVELCSRVAVARQVLLEMLLGAEGIFAADSWKEVESYLIGTLDQSTKEALEKYKPSKPSVVITETGARLDEWAQQATAVPGGYSVKSINAEPGHEEAIFCKQYEGYQLSTQLVVSGEQVQARGRFLAGTLLRPFRQIEDSEWLDVQGGMKLLTDYAGALEVVSGLTVDDLRALIRPNPTA
ncbi:MAG TPA: hypothetical protein VHD60_03195 [Candidatus Saccharimonadales bacterium]|nr:hypothetical protein [Candidatus Saccharimonadales bacterium]